MLFRSPGIDSSFDECSQTVSTHNVIVAIGSTLISYCWNLQAYVYNENTNVMVSFDNARSFAAKGAFIKNEKLRGFAMWEAGGDSKDILLDSIRAAAGAA